MLVEDEILSFVFPSFFSFLTNIQSYAMYKGENEQIKHITE
jgi:hypothetical protein